VPSGFLDRFNSCCFSRCSLDSRSCFASGQASGGALGALGSLQQWLLCSVPGEQAACSASSLALVRRGSRQQEVSSGGGCSCSSSSRQRPASSRPASICARPRTATPRVSSLHGSSSKLIVLVNMQIPVTSGDSGSSGSGCMFDAQQLFDELSN
jgi:hypothetical protein